MKRFKQDRRRASGPRLSDVADAAGVSIGTASNVFNRPHLVRAEVREHVEAVAAELGYGGPDPAGRLLMGGKANSIGVLPPGDMPVATAFRSPFFHEFVHGIAEVCDAQRASLVVLSGAADSKAWAIRNALVDGFILGHRDEIALVEARPRPVPCVVMDMEPEPGHSSVCIDGADGARQAASHLLDLGHRRIVLISILREPGPPVVHPGWPRGSRLTGGFPLDEEKLAACLSVFAKAGIDPAAVPVIEAYTQPPWSDEGARTLLDTFPDATAVLSFSDRDAVALLVEARTRGVRVPEELSVVGFDDSPEAAAATPPLTTVAQPLIEKGRLAASILFEDLPEPRHETLPTRLVLRASTAKPRA